MIVLNYEIIFYHSGKTAEIEQTISSKLSKIGMELSQSAAATSPSEVADCLSKSLKRADVIIIVGGLDGGKQSTDNVLSTIISTNGAKIQSNKIVDEDGNISYIIECLEQTIIIFPDDSSIISEMIDKKIFLKLKENYELTQNNDTAPSIESITDKLDSQLSQISRNRVKINTLDLKNKKEKSSSKILKFSVYVLVCLAFAMLFTAGYIYLTNYIL